MITTNGKLVVKRYLAQYVPTMAQSIAFGIGAATETLADIALQLQVAQSQIDVVAYDFVNNAVVYKASVPDDYVGSIYEVGLYSLVEDPNATNFGSQTLSTFDSQTELWTDTGTGNASTFGASSTRVGIDSLLQTPALSTTKTDRLAALTLDLSGYSGSDYFTFAYNVANTNTTGVTFRFMTDGSNYYSFALSGTNVTTTGYKIVTANKSTATVTGAPSWANITEVQVATTSGAGGASALAFDAIRIEDVDSINLDYVLVARKVLSSPVTKVAGQAQDIEFSLDVTV